MLANFHLYLWDTYLCAMKAKLLSVSLFVLILGACTAPTVKEKSPKNSADAIVDSAIAAAGGNKYENAKISFNFRGTPYSSMRSGGEYTYTRSQTDSAGNTTLDILNNNGFSRTRNEQPINLPDSAKRIYANSVNSVHYFMQLPYGLNDAAVNKTLLDTVSIRGNNYFKIKVTFDEEGGGEDHEDVFLYWFDVEDYSMDYLAYSFHVDGGGMRFREAVNNRKIEGISFSDYRNYKPRRKDIEFEEIDQLFNNNELELLSKIENTNIQVVIAQ